jgi:hypothetical protein
MNRSRNGVKQGARDKARNGVRYLGWEWSYRARNGARNGVTKARDIVGSGAWNEVRSENRNKDVKISLLLHNGN